MKLSYEIIELFEDFIEEHGGLVNNPERDEAIASRQDDPDCIAHIYGIDYGNLQDELELLLECSGVDISVDTDIPVVGETHPAPANWVEEYKAEHTTASVHWSYPATGGIDLTFRVTANGNEETRHYKTRAAAKAAETKFYNRVDRLWK